MTCLLYVFFWLCHCTLVYKRSTFCNQFKFMNDTVKKKIKKIDRPTQNFKFPTWGQHNNNKKLALFISWKFQQQKKKIFLTHCMVSESCFKCSRCSKRQVFQYLSYLPGKCIVASSNFHINLCYMHININDLRPMYACNQYTRFQWGLFYIDHSFYPFCVCSFQNVHFVQNGRHFNSFSYLSGKRICCFITFSYQLALRLYEASKIQDQYMQLVRKFNTLYHATIGFNEQTSTFPFSISEIWTSISRIMEPIQGMFVLFWMHFPWRFQIL